MRMKSSAALPNNHSDCFQSRSQGEDEKARKKGAIRNGMSPGTLKVDR